MSEVTSVPPTAVTSAYLFLGRGPGRSAVTEQDPLQSGKTGYDEA
jgi:hypothetical protein